jgi:hypothetical protein
VLRRHLTNDSPGVAGGALAPYVRIRGDAAVPDVQSFLCRNRDRTDGLAEAMGALAVRALGDLDTAAGDEVLIAELARGAEPGWLPDYGSDVVRALAKPGRKAVERSVGGARVTRPKRPLSPAARAAMEAYAASLTRRLPGEDNPPGRRYYQEKIDEVRRALAESHREG